MAYLPRHVEGLRPWLHLASEVVVVDSFSTDGTVEYLREHLAHPQVKFVSHPPGLYASWNHGIAQISAKYLFIATTGDVITSAGINHLVATAEDLHADVVISKPEFRDLQGRAAEIAWPIDDVIATLKLRAPRRLHKLEAVVFAAVHATGALLGSCASNVFRTEGLRRFPFPTTFGTAGDGAWGLQHAADVTWAVTPERFSTFLIHPSAAGETDRRQLNHAPPWDQVLHEAATRWLQTGAITPTELAEIHWPELLENFGQYLRNKTTFDHLRRRALPWILTPSAWLTRRNRNQARRRLDVLRTAGLRAVPQPAGIFP